MVSKSERIKSVKRTTSATFCTPDSPFTTSPLVPLGVLAPTALTVVPSLDLPIAVVLLLSPPPNLRLTPTRYTRSCVARSSSRWLKILLIPKYIMAFLLNRF